MAEGNSLRRFSPSPDYLIRSLLVRQRYLDLFSRYRETQKSLLIVRVYYTSLETLNCVFWLCVTGSKSRLMPRPAHLAEHRA